MERGKQIKAQQKEWGIRDREIAAATGLSIDTIRKIGRAPFAEETYDAIEACMETLRKERIRVLQTKMACG